MVKHVMAALLVAMLIFVACKKGDLRGTYAASRDGKTYLAVDDDNGGHCGPLKVDGKVWLHPIGEAALIAPGHHTIECGSSISFNIPQGVVYKFDYWGP